jgi:ring-1,2-phenylacetyl-CoA epoxidase subunit PaaC
MSEIGPAERAVLLAFADDEHLMGQRHTEWIGVAPFLEEDLAFASIGQDELGHAAMLYELLDPDADADALAFGRTPEEYRSCWLAEAACTEWADALVRHFLYDEAEQLRWQQLASSADERVSAIAHRALSEEVYHRRHADALLDALVGDAEATQRVDDAARRLVPLALGMFDVPAGGEDANSEIVGQPLFDLIGRWGDSVSRRLREVVVSTPLADQRRRTQRSPEFAAVYARMREVLLLDPTARW